VVLCVKINNYVTFSTLCGLISVRNEIFKLDVTMLALFLDERIKKGRRKSIARRKYTVNRVNGCIYCIKWI